MFLKQVFISKQVLWKDETASTLLHIFLIVLMETDLRKLNLLIIIEPVDKESKLYVNVIHYLSHWGADLLKEY